MYWNLAEIGERRNESGLGSNTTDFDFSVRIFVDFIE